MNSDDHIRRRVEGALARDTRIGERNFGVSVHVGVVTLFGTVANCAERRLAAEVAAATVGVRAVANETDVKIPNEGQSSDGEIAEWVASVLHHTVPALSQSIRVVVNQGWVSLAGQLDAPSEKAAAEGALIAHGHSSIKGILNGITLKPKRAAFERERHQAFWRLAGLRARGILIDFKGDAIILRGTVSSYRDRNDAALAAWSAPGVTSVENLLIVRS